MRIFLLLIAAFISVTASFSQTTDCSTATVLTAVNASSCTPGTTFNVIGTGTGPTMSSCNTNGTAANNWGQFVANGPTATISYLPASNRNAMIYAYSGTCPGSLTEISCVNTGNNGAQEDLSLTGLTPGNTYYVRIVRYGSTNSMNGSICIASANTITTGTISGSPFCAGTTLSVPFTSTGTFTSNTYTAQLSDAAGSFSSPVSIGTLVSNANSGSISATLPAGTATGTGYRIRVVSSSPSTTGANNGTNITINALPALPSAGNNSRCGTGSVTISATPGSGETIDWYAAASGGTALVTGNTSYTTGSLSSTATYYAEARNTTTGCVSLNRTAVAATINTIPSVTLSNFTAICSGTTSTTLSYTSPVNSPDQYSVNWSAAANAAGMSDIGWTTLSASPIAISGLITTAGTYTADIYVRNSSTGCQSTVSSYSSICGTANEGSSVTLSAPGGYVFTAINFASYGTPTGSCGSFTTGSCHASSSLSVVQAAALGNNSFTIAASNAVFGDPCFGTGKNLAIEAVYSLQSLTINAQPTVTSSTGAARCSAGTVTITATAGTGETIDWYAAASGGTALLTGSTSYTTPSISATTTYYAQARNSTTGCISATRTAVTASVNYPAAPTAGNNSRCGTGTVTISATPGSGETIDWYAAAVGGTALLTGNTFYTTPSISSSTTYYAQVRNTTNGCLSATRTAVAATVSSFPATPAAGNNSRCGTGTVTISATPGSGETIDWYAAASGGTALLTGSTSYTTASISTTTIYYAEARNIAAGCLSAARTAVTATVNALPADKTISATSPTVCSGTSTSITIPLSDGGINYQLRNNAGNANIGSAVSGTGGTISLSTGNLSSNSTFNVLATNATTGCNVQMSATVTISVTPLATVTPGGTLNSCQSATPGAITLTGASVGGAASTGAWSVTSGSGTLSSTAQTASPATVTFTPAPNYSGTVVLTLTTDAAGGCTPASSTRTINVNALPTVTISTNYCIGGGAVRLTSSAQSSYLWSTGATTQSIDVSLAGSFTVTGTNAAGCSATASVSVAQELVTNGNFSAGNTGFITLYTYTTTNLVPESYYAVGTNPNTYHSNFFGRDHTTGTGNFMIVNGSPTTQDVWQQSVTVTPNTNYYFSAWAVSVNNGSPFAQLRFAVNDVQIGTTANLTAGPTSTSGVSNWVQFYGTWNSGSNTTAKINIIDLQTAAGGNDFGIDDISFSTLAPVTMTIAASANTPVCTGTAINLTSTITGGSSPYTYAWTGPSSYSSTSQNPVISSAAGGNNGVYSLTVTDTYGCTATASTGFINVTGGSAALTSGSGSNIQSVCNNSAITNITYSVSGGATGATVSGLPAGVTGTFSGGVFTISGTPTVKGIFNYSVVTTGSSCTVTLTGTITVNAPTIAGLTSTCIGATTQLTGNGTPASSNPWVSSNPAVATVSSTGLITGVSAGTSVITYRDNTGCGITASVTVNALPTITGTLFICNAGATRTLTGSGTANATNPWTSSNTGVATVSNTGVVTSVAAGTTTITYTNNNGCSVGATFTVSVPTISGSLTLCGIGSTRALTGSGTAAASNPWVSATTSVATVSATGVVTAVAAGTSVITYTNNLGCTVTATVTVYASPTISGTLTFCANSSTTLTGSGTPAASNPWASANTGVATVNSSGVVTGVAGGTSVITYTNNNGCTATATVTVTAAIVNNTISTSQSICTNTTPAQLTGATPTGGTGTYTYLWQSSTTSASTGFATASGTSNGINYTPGTLFQTTWYRRTVTSGTCSDVSAAIQITVSPIIGSNSFTSAQTICSGSAPIAFTGAAPSGGNGTYTYLWESSTNSSTGPFSTAAGTSNAVNYAPAVLTQNTWFRRTVFSGGCSSISTVLLITVNPAIANHTVSASQAICSGSTPSPLTNSTLLSGGSGTYSYVWESSTTSSATGFGPASGSNLFQNYNPPALTQTTWYRTTITSGGCTSVATPIVITVTPTLAGNTITADQTICTGTAPATLTGSIPTGGNGSFTYLWESSTISGTFGFATASGTSNAKDYAPSTLTQNTWYRRTVTSGSCSIVSAPIQVTVTAAIGTNTITAAQTICRGSTPAALAGSAPTGGSGTYTYLWESSITSAAAGFSTATGTSNTIGYTPAALTQTTWFRRTVTSGGCANTSATVQITVTPAIANNTLSSTAAICNGGSATITGSTPTGGTGSYTYSWESSTTSASTGFTAVACVCTAQNLPATSLTQNTWYRRTVTSGICSSTSAAILITVNPSGQWVGGTSGDWNVAGNWCGGIPTSSTNVNIPSGSTITIQSTNAVANNVTISAGGSLVMTGAYNLTISAGGTFTNNGTFTASASTGSVIFNGNGTISGTTTFQNIDTKGALNFGTASTINGTFTLQTGGSVTGNSPTYACPSSTLQYNTGTVFTRGLEWTTTPSGAGYPANVIVQTNTTINFPAVGQGYVCNDLTIQNGGSLMQNYSGGSASLSVGRNVVINGTLALGGSAGGDITVGGSWTRNTGATFTANDRKVTFDGPTNFSGRGTSFATISAPASTLKDNEGGFGGEKFAHIWINKTNATDSVVLLSNITVTRELGFTKGTLSLRNSDVTLVSNISRTADIAPVTTPANVAIRYAGSGRFNIQRYVSNPTAVRSWRLLTAPVQSATAPTINEAWQYSTVNPDKTQPNANGGIYNPWPGYGTHITGTGGTYSLANGFDQGTNAASILSAGAGVTTWANPSSTTATKVTDQPGWMLFVRGDRSFAIGSQYTPSQSATLETRGIINIGNVVKAVSAGKQVIGNPYPSAISFRNVDVSGTLGKNTNYYRWDPKMFTSYTQPGKWVSFTGLGSSFISTTAASLFDVNGTIESGEAIIIEPAASGSITFHESDKLALTSSLVGIANKPLSSYAILRSDMYAGNGSDYTLTDAVVNIFETDFNNKVTEEDVKKIVTFNTKESFSIERDSTKLAIEKRRPVNESDTIFYGISRFNMLPYQLRFTPTGFDPTVSAFLEDTYLHKTTPVSLQAPVTVDFEITSDPSSSSTSRFRLVLKQAGVLPVTFTDVKAWKEKTDIAVEWQVQNELSIKQYEMQKSTNGIDFTTIVMVPAKGNYAGSRTYSQPDHQPAAGDNFYRIRSVGNDGTGHLSKIVKVNSTAAANIKLYSNPVTDGAAKLHLANAAAGKYIFRLLNAAGQTLVTKEVRHTAGDLLVKIETMQKLAAGNYTIEVVQPGSTSYVSVMYQ